MVRFEVVVKDTFPESFRRRLPEVNPNRRLSTVNPKNGEGLYWDAYGHPGRSYYDGANYFYARVIIGTPGKAFDLIIDSGSPLAYLPCSDRCETCGTHSHYPLNVLESKSFSEIGCEEKFCKRHFRCRQEDKKCSYSISYGEGSHVHGTLIHEKIWLGDDYIPVNIGCIEVETKLIFKQDADGLMGINDNPYTLPNQVIQYKQEKNPNFANMIQLCYGQDGGFMEIGDANLPKDLKWTPMPRGGRHNWYGATVMNIQMDGKDLVTGKSKDKNFGNGKGITSDIDTGCTNFGLPGDLYDAYLNKLMSKMTYTWKKELNSHSMCFWHWNSKVMRDTAPTMDIFLKDGVVLKLDHHNFLYTKLDGRVCSSVGQQGGTGILMGGNIFKNHFVAIDKKNQRLGIKSFNCLDRPSEPVPGHILDINASNKRTKKVTEIVASLINLENFLFAVLIFIIASFLWEAIVKRRRRRITLADEKSTHDGEEDLPLMMEQAYEKVPNDDPDSGIQPIYTLGSPDPEEDITNQV